MTRFVRRIVRAVGDHIAQEDPESLPLLLEIESAVKEAYATAIAGMRHSGFTDREIGEVLGTTRQAVEQRWPRTP
jgi:hypothetical protein